MSTETIQGFSLSPQQKYVWSRQRQASGGPWRSRIVVAVDGELTPVVLTQALRSLVEREELLRTTFRTLPGMPWPLQVVSVVPGFVYRHQDLRGCDVAGQDRVRRAAVEDGTPQFDLQDETPLHVLQLTFHERRHLLVIELPALCADAATLDLLVREMRSAYDDCRAGRPLRPAALQYADLAETLNVCLESPDYDEGRQAWHRWRDAEASPRRQAPSGLSSAPERPFAPRVRPLRLDASLRQALVDRAVQAGVRCESWLLACWGLLLCRLAAEDELAIGVCCDGRTMEPLAELLGPLARYVPIAVDVRPSDTIVDLARRLDQRCGDGIAQQHFFDPNLDAHQAPPAAMLFEYREIAPQESAQEPRVTLLARQAIGDQFSIKLTATHDGGDLHCDLEYDTARHGAQVIDALASQLTVLLHAAVDRPDAPALGLRLLTIEDERRLTTLGTGPARPYPADRVDELFLAQAATRPDAIALDLDGQQICYATLADRSAQLARYLRANGVGPDSRVALCLDRSLELMIGILGVLRAGGAYVPLDPDSPPHRLRQTLADSDARLVLALGTSADRLGDGAEVLQLDRDWPRIAATAAEAPDASQEAIQPDHLAYVISTSGSTGVPKAAGTSHRALTNHMAWICETFALGPADVIVQKTAYSFDASVWEFFAALITGGRLALAAPGEHRDPERLVSRLHQVQATIVQFVPSVLAEVVRQPALETCRSLRLIFVGGEGLPPELCQRLAGRLPAAEVVNLYGPTEVTIDATYWRWDAADPADGILPIGRPIANLQAFVVDPDGRLLPAGVPGELYLGGAGLGRGYLGRPALTAERFVPDACSGQPGARLYRSGDRARWRTDGVLAYLGRGDQQVKLRGHRIELGDVESALGRVPGIQQRRVFCQPDPHGQPRLVAYVTTEERAPTATLAARWRVALHAQLPEYMIPSAFVVVATWPLTPNGKLDWRALPPPEAVETPAADTMPPRPGVEELIAAIWAQVLQREDIGRHDSFFALGGHSLLATQVISRLRAVFGVDLPLRTLFDTPTVAELGAWLEKARGAATTPPSPVTPIPRPVEGLPLSYAQQRLWFLAQLDPDSPVYTIPYALRVRGTLDERALARSLRTLGARHEILRTRFVTHAREPRQQVDAGCTLTFPVIDLRTLSPAARDACVRRLARADAARPFALSAAPLWRLYVLRLADDERVLMLALHHIISDGWSVPIFVRELGALYQAQQDAPADAGGSLAPLPIQYADFAVWQRQWLSGDTLDAQLAYWRAQLDGLRPLALPTDRPRPAIASHRTGVVRFTADADLTRGLLDFSRREGVTLFMTLLAAFAAVLGRWAGQDEVAISTDVANRSRIETEGLIGFFVNQLVLRVSVRSDGSLRALLARVRQIALDAYAHQDVPFERVVSALAPARDLSRAPLAQVRLVLQNAPVERLTLGTSSIEPIEADNAAAEGDLTLIVDQGDRLNGTLQFATDLFDRATADGVLQAWLALLADAVAQPDRTVDALTLMRADDRQRVLAAGTGAAVTYPDPACLHTVVSTWAQRTPDAVAIVSESHHVTYRTLDARARQVAAFLASQQIATGSLVAVALTRSPEQIIALLGIFHAGAAYLPLDPEYPDDRLAFILDDARPRLLLAQAATAARCRTLPVPVVAIDAEWASIATARAPLLDVAADAPAYVIYTSGSTGRPKGAMNTHRGVRNRVLWQRDALRMGPGDRLLGKTPLTFDVSAGEIFSTLVSGACLVLARPGGHREADYLAELMAAERVTLIHFVPSMLDAFLRDDLRVSSSGAAASLRCLICSGEALTADVLHRAQAQLPGIVCNLYGPTEASVDVAWWWSDHDAARTTVPIGRPIANTRLTIVDAGGQVQPAAFPGELTIGGVAVGVGYPGRPALTADRFRPDPYAPEPGARCYRTGDIARWQPDGEIAYLGRRDRQVKMRGFRVELGEVEAVLCERPGVRQAAALLREDEPGHRRLVAYVVTDPAMPAAWQDWRQWLQARLPDYMVPAALVTIAEWPLSANGKIDYRALPPPETIAVASSASVAPRTVLERTLAGIWQDVLKLPAIGVDDNFFELGGDSILSLHIVARALQDGLACTVRDMFQHQTIAALARALTERRPAAAALTEADDDPSATMPLTPIQQWFFAQPRTAWQHFNQALWLTVREPLVLSALRLAWRRIGQQHVALRSRFARMGTGWRQTVAHDDDAATWLSVVDVSEVSPEERPALLQRVAARAQGGFDLAKGPLVRVVYATTRSSAGWLLVVAHHLVIDGVGWRILLDHLQQVYGATRRDPGREVALPRTSSLQAWSRALTRLAGDGRLDGERAWWAGEVGAPVARCPRDRDGGNPARGARHHAVTWSAEGTRALLEHLPRVSRQSFQVALLAALTESFGAWLDTDSVLLDLEGHGRQSDLLPELDLTQTVGWCTSIFPLRLPRRPGAPIRDQLDAVAVKLSSVPHDGVGYGVLRYLAPGGEALASGAEILFNYLGQLDRALASDGLLGPAPLASGPSDGGAHDRPYLLEINSAVQDGRLWMDWTYGPQLHDEATIARLATQVLRQLDRVVESIAGAERPLQPADFPLAGLRADQLAHLAARLQR